MKRKPQTKFTDKMFFAICDTIAETSLSITAVCRKHNTSKVQFYRHLNKSIRLNETVKCNYYAHAREAQADIFFNEMIRAAKKVTLMKKTLTHGKGGGETDTKKYLTNEGIQAARLYIDTLKFAVAKLAPKKYGDTLNLNNTVEKLSHEDLLKRLNGD
ncbi:MAG: hypothetical protein KF900_07895 [Bacteroidetes bacterium]|nr:hypothetical protein [Bacteroidota bacterium]